MSEVIHDTHIHKWGRGDGNELIVIPSKPNISLLKKILNKLRKKDAKL